MGFRARGRFFAPRFAMALLAIAFVQQAWATPPSFTGAPITAQLPDFDAPISINLRAQGVITGTAPITFSTRSIQFLVNGDPNTLIQAVPVGNVCVTLINLDFTPQPGDTYALRFGMESSQGQTAVTDVVLVNTPGPVANPQDPACLDPNSPPLANAGPDRNVPDSNGVPGEAVQLSALASDPENDQLTYAWFLGDEPVASGPSPTINLPDGENVLTLVVFDEHQEQATDTVLITVEPPPEPEPQPPTANAGSDRVIDDTDGIPGEDVTLNGSGTDSDGEIVEYVWFSGQTVIGREASVTVRLADGTHVLTLQVTDDDGLTATDTVLIQVNAPQPLTVDAGPDRTIEDTDLEPGETVQLSGSASMPGATIVSYEWLLGSDLLGTGASLTTRLPDGVNLVTLRVTTSTNVVGTASVQITVGAPVRTVLAELPGLNGNQRRLAERLDQACNQVLAEPLPEDSPDRADFAEKCRGLLFSRDTAALVNALDQLLGDDFAVARTQTLLFANMQLTGVMDRLMALRGGARGLSLAGLSIIVDGQRVPLAELADFIGGLLGGGASNDPDVWGERWGVWMRGNYSFGSKDADTLSPRFDANQYALLAGLDYRFSPNAVAGVAFAYGDASIDFKPSTEGSLDTRSWALSLYGSMYTSQKQKMYLDAIVNIADTSYDARRNITYVDGFGLVTVDAFGSTGGLTVSGGVSGGYDFLVGRLTISPAVGVFYIDAKIDSFTESGAGGLNLMYDDQRFKSLTANAGLRMTLAWNQSWGVLLPHLRADFVREFEDDVEVFGIRFASDPNAPSAPPILVETDNPDTSYWRLAGGFSAQFPYGVSGYVEYQRLESFQGISFEDVSLGLRFQKNF